MTERRPRDLLADIFNAGVSAVEPGSAVRRRLCRERNILHLGDASWDLDHIAGVYVLGFGKASAAMAAAVEEALGDRISGGVVVTEYGHGVPLAGICVREAGHPTPDENGLEGATQLARTAVTASEGDLVVCCISGGGSALLPLPAQGLTLEDMKEVTRMLLASGADIREINALRKHLSMVKGGQLAQMVAPANLINLILSDVVGDPLDVIASGPTSPDRSTFQDCLDVLNRRRLTRRVPQSVLERLRLGAQGAIAETPKPGDAVFEKVHYALVGTNRVAVDACERRAREVGYTPLTLSTTIQGETSDIARMHGSIAREIATHGPPVAGPCCVLSGGETTVTIRGDGKGGRNQEFVLATAIEIAGLEKVSVLSAGTDGIDGPTDAAGAFADGQTCPRAIGMDMEPMDFLLNNDSYHFFEELGDLFITGPTRTNVMDLRLILID